MQGLAVDTTPHFVVKRILDENFTQPHCWSRAPRSLERGLVSLQNKQF
jgi:hypothetical protein